MSEKAKNQEPKYKNSSIALKPYTLKEIASLYGVCTRTIRRWMKPFENEIGEKRGRYYTIPQVKIFFDNLSLPSMMDTD